MSVYWSQQEADAEIIRNLLNELRRYKLMPLLQLADGRVIRVEQFEVVTNEELQADLVHAQNRVNELQSFLPAAPAAPAQPEVPTTNPEAPLPPVEGTPVAGVDPNATASVESTSVEQPPLQ